MLNLSHNPLCAAGVIALASGLQHVASLKARRDPALPSRAARCTPECRMSIVSACTHMQWALPNHAVGTLSGACVCVP